MSRRARGGGFSLIELLLVLFIIGILSAIAIPSLMGQRQKARLIGDASANTRVLAMALENRKADNGTYAAGGANITYTSASAARPVPDLAATFVPKGNSNMDFNVNVAASGLTYTITVKDTVSGTMYYQVDQTGAVLYKIQ